MQCPKCKAEMEDVEIHQLTVKRCLSCKGLWFDRSKHEYLKGLEDSGYIDSGDTDVGKSYNTKGDILCPDCFAPMIRMVVADQPHIWYESCSKCFSVYFDAGEFRDYMHKDIIDIIRDLFAHER
jgi:Zn-finger nucleic acid-binding protein